MIRRVFAAVARALSSTALAVGLLVFASAWCAIATAIPQGTSNNAKVAEWIGAHAALEPVVRAAGLHDAFASPIFLVCVLLVALSTVVCSWKRTLVAIRRTRRLRAITAMQRDDLIASHDLEIPVASGLTADEAVSRAQSVLSGLGVRTTRTGDVISTISPWWSVWGSPLFHWSLVALVAVIALGTTLRSDGVMALAVGQSKADMPASYLTVTAGPLRAWTRSPRHIRLDSLEPDLRVGGIDRGAVPTVAVLDSRGSVIARQRVYPNMMLHSGSLSINAPTVGLSVTMAIIDTTGEESSRFIQLVDFSQVATEGTVPASALQFTDLAGNRLITSVTVPLDRAGSGFGEWIPKTKRARVEIADASGSGISQLVGQGQDVLLPSGEALRLIDIGWYSGLSIVDDPTVPFVYGVMALALIGLTLTLLMRQQYFVATYADRDGPHLVVAIRLWGNAPTDRREIVMELEQALASPVKGNTL